MNEYLSEIYTHMNKRKSKKMAETDADNQNVLRYIILL